MVPSAGEGDPKVGLRSRGSRNEAEGYLRCTSRVHLFADISWRIVLFSIARYRLLTLLYILTQPARIHLHYVEMTRISCTSTHPENTDYVEFPPSSAFWKLHDRHFPLARRSAAMVIQASSFKYSWRPLFRAVTYLGRLGSWADRSRRTFSLVNVITSLISAITAGGHRSQASQWVWIERRRLECNGGG